MRNGTSREWSAAAALLVILAACGGENEPPADGLAVAKAAASGDGQTGTAGTALANPLAVVVSRDGVPEEGVAVSWSVLTGGGTLGGASSSTNGQGIATMPWTLGTTAGDQTVRATVSDATGSPLTFSATATAGAAAALALAGGSGQSAAINAALANPLQVRATDQFGNSVAGVSVEWAVTSGGGSVNPGESVTAANGTAATAWTLGSTLGAQTAQASATGLTGSPVAFSATASAAPDPSNGVTVGNNFFDPASRTVPAGTTVTWTWVNTGAISHSVESVGTPSFTSSAILSGSGQQYSVTFDTPGTYEYECVVHGSAMAGEIIVQ
jgi:plastocyanin